ncbi:4-hydroxybenzoate octaprenyltransferase [Alphaproteobacteria bacterium]|nr:4-hydroxybenzoate octaprenyltransferase [Alphaproteobacteria bacterium]
MNIKTDMPNKGWWDKLPKKYHKWIRLGRFDRPIGSWLLLLPCLWTLPIFLNSITDLLEIYFIFIIGAFSMRAAGCTINDLWDKDIDKKISRTRHRPIASGEVSTKAAFGFLIILLTISLLCLLNLNKFTWLIALSSLPLIVLYPLAKRVTKWPQFVLGITFSWGVPTAWAATNTDFNTGILFLYLGTVFWVIGYDTIYGYQDKFEDKIFNVKNTAITTENYYVKFITFFYLISISNFLLAGIILKIHFGWYIGLFFMLIHFIYQIQKTKMINRYESLKLFNSNRIAGLFLTIGSLSKFLEMV